MVRFRESEQSAKDAVGARLAPVVEAPANQRSDTSNLSALLSKATQHLRELPDGDNLVSHLGALAQRLVEGRFHLAVLGQFKRGKSTLLNALLGQHLLPTAVVPSTSIPTFIRWGPEPAACVHFEDQRAPHGIRGVSTGELGSFLARHVTEEENPRNTRAVERVQVFYPSPLLEKGMVFIDTPGIGSTHRHNTEATLRLLPQCDAALFLVSADPPITELELHFLQEVKPKVARLFFVLNKADYLGAGEVTSAVEFLRDVLVSQVGMPCTIPIFCVSAKQALEARTRGDRALWENSGLAGVEQHLVTFMMTGKLAALTEAVRQKAAGVVAQGLMQAEIGVRSFQMPLEELEQRLGLFKASIDEAQRRRTVAGDLLSSDHNRVQGFLEEQVRKVRDEAQKHLRQVALGVTERGRESDPGSVKEALASEIPAFFERQAVALAGIVGLEVEKAITPRQEEVDRLMAKVRKTAADLLDVPYRLPQNEDSFQVTREPYWVTHKWASTFSPDPMGLIERLLPAAARRERWRRALLHEVDQLVVHNTENLRWAMLLSIDETFTRVRWMLDERWAETIAVTLGALRAAMERRRTESHPAEKEIARLRSTTASLEDVYSDLGGGTREADACSW